MLYRHECGKVGNVRYVLGYRARDSKAPSMSWRFDNLYVSCQCTEAIILEAQSMVGKLR